ncbi:MAG TPA: PHP domain-containing protein [Dehalococcoidia bacterium]|nr:PHP domain-containing protein [Dehalococcoidia bacterium]
MPLIRADLHSHTHFSRDGWTTPERYVQRAVARGIGWAAVSDHNNIDGAVAVRRLAKYAGALKVIIAEEIRSTEGEIIGYFLKEPIAKGLTPEETVRAIREQGGIVGVPHPCDRYRGSAIGLAALSRIVDDVDVIEVFNARNMKQEDNLRALRFAREHGLLESAGSDAHVHTEIGSAWVEMPDFETPEGFLESLKQGRIHGRLSSPFVHLLSSAAKLRFKLGMGPAR